MQSDPIIFHFLPSTITLSPAVVVQCVCIRVCVCLFVCVVSDLKGRLSLTV